MSEDWLPPENKRKLKKSYPLLWAGGSLFILSLIVGLSFRSNVEEEVPPRRRALGEVSFLFEASPMFAASQQREAAHLSRGRSGVRLKSTPSAESTSRAPTRSRPLGRVEELGTTLRIPKNERAPTPSLLTLTPKVEPKPEPKLEPKLEPKPEPRLEPKLEPRLEPKPEPRLEPKPEPRPKPKPEPRLEPKPEPRPKPKPEPRPKPKPEPRPKPKPEPRPKPKPKPRSTVESTTWDQASFSLQVKAFRSEQEASTFLDELDRLWPDLPTRILTGTSRSRPIYRVLLGAFKSREEAKLIRREFMEKFGKRDKPFIKKIK